jgi:hypothetical protein
MHKNAFVPKNDTINDHFLLFLFSFVGGSGFLGQHIVRLIEERDSTVKEIRIVDLRPYENRLGKYRGGERKYTKGKKQNTREINFNPKFIFTLSFVCFFP